MSLLSRAVTNIMQFGINHILCRIHATGMEKIPAHGPLIIYTNHTGSIEVPALYAQIYPRPATGWAKIESWDNWFLTWIYNLWGAIPIRRGEADMTALKKALSMLEQGYIFGIAPEGTRNRTGQLIRAKPGMVMLALISGAPLMPVANWGGENFRANLKKFRRTDFYVHAGEIFKINTNGVRVTGEMRQEIVDEMMYRLAALLPEEYRGEYSDLDRATGKYFTKI
ncbi:MAG TPA: lysophospholipid acyltransferase family protein [Anaerolineales bacterium]|jgi:1-acyl-sn-glycerol-3-phosphate acyltransferase|nr:lysophospholipid acyltransferase family protein [Anaerolineales bacterium]